MSVVAMRETRRSKRSAHPDESEEGSVGSEAAHYAMPQKLSKHAAVGGASRKPLHDVTNQANAIAQQQPGKNAHVPTKKNQKQQQVVETIVIDDDESET